MVSGMLRGLNHFTAIWPISKTITLAGVDNVSSYFVVFFLLFVSLYVKPFEFEVSGKKKLLVWLWLIAIESV